MRGLAEKDGPISQDNLEEQFLTYNDLAARQRERSLEGLLRKARHSELSAVGKVAARGSELQRRPVSPGPSGAKGPGSTIMLGFSAAKTFSG